MKAWKLASCGEEGLLRNIAADSPAARVLTRSYR